MHDSVCELYSDLSYVDMTLKLIQFVNPEITDHEFSLKGIKVIRPIVCSESNADESNKIIGNKTRAERFLHYLKCQCNVSLVDKEHNLLSDQDYENDTALVLTASFAKRIVACSCIAWAAAFLCPHTHVCKTWHGNHARDSHPTSLFFVGVWRKGQPALHQLHPSTHFD